jgi:hypothetical protein
VFTLEFDVMPGELDCVAKAVGVAGVLFTLAQRVDCETSEVSEPPQLIIFTDAISPAVSSVRTILLSVVALAVVATPT